MPPFNSRNLLSLVICALLFPSTEGCESQGGGARDHDYDPATGDPSADGGDSLVDGAVVVPADAEASASDGVDAGAASDSGVSWVPEPPPSAIYVPPAPQTKGDAEKGYDYLVNGDYQTLGLPWSGFSATMNQLDPRDSVPGRTGDNAQTSYMFNVVTDPDGIKVAASNCLSCHASHLNGKVFVGLGNPNPSGGYRSSGMSVNIPGILLNSTPEEVAVALKYTERLVNSARFGAMNVFPELASHHDPKTLVWSDEPLFDADTGLVGSVDIPPWWRCKKKNGLYYTGVARGEQGRHMSFMSVFSVRDAEEGRIIQENFVNVGEFIRSIEPPPFPGSIDRDLAAAGEQVFLGTCATCHGTYGENWTYPNVVIPYEEVGTDPFLATNNWVNEATSEWFAESFYAGDGQSWMENLPGYYAPPLDGIWATAPFFHNGSVPTLDGVIDPEKRPAVWASGYGDEDYDLERVGWKEAEGGASLTRRFDSSRPGYSNQGHTYGAALAAEDQRALLEFLKTL